MDRTSKNKSTEDVLDIIKKASGQYEEYVRIAEAAAAITARAPVGDPVAGEWDRPIGLVIRASAA
jgi:hypothetical protein